MLDPTVETWSQPTSTSLCCHAPPSQEVSSQCSESQIICSTSRLKGKYLFSNCLDMIRTSSLKALQPGLRSILQSMSTRSTSTVLIRMTTDASVFTKYSLTRMTIKRSILSWTWRFTRTLTTWRLVISSTSTPITKCSAVTWTKECQQGRL